MRALVIYRPFESNIDVVNDPEPRANEIVIKTKACGICGTDIHIFRGEEPRTLFPIIPGHELAGVIIDMGKDIKDFSVGDIVAVDPNIACGRCYYCKIGSRHFCENWEGIGVTRPGGFAEKVAVPVDNLYKVPRNIPLERAALVEPLSCILHGLDAIMPLKGGEKIAIFGAGPIGLMFLAILRRFTIADIAVFEVQPQRAKKAIEFKADIVENPTEIDLYKFSQEFTHGKGFNVVIDATGNIEAISRILKLDIVAPQAKILLFGVAPTGRKVELEPYMVFRKEVSIMGTIINPYTTQRAIMLLDELPELDTMIDRISLEEALNILRGTSGKNYIKPMIIF
ncbi:MAG: alcohol dehydrogenase catalytic domain-containing protein [Desulfurococcaceae archaeon]